MNSLTKGQEEAILSWLSFAVTAPAPGQDLHIDTIDPSWKDRAHWIAAGFSAFRYAAEELRRLSTKDRIVLVFSLRSATDPLGINFADMKMLEGEFDWSPPALYLIRDEQLSRLYAGTKNLPLTILADGTGVRELRLMEFKPERSVEYARSLHVMSHGAPR